MSLREEFTDSIILSKFQLCRRSQELERPRYTDEKVVRRLSFKCGACEARLSKRTGTNSGSTKVCERLLERSEVRAGHFFFNAETGMGAGEAAQPYACKCMMLFNSSVLYNAYFGSRCTSTAAIAEP